MTAELLLTATDEHDGTLMVTVRGRSGSFAGEGTACFGKPELLVFSSQLEELVAEFKGQPEVAGGFFNLDGELETTLVWLKFYAADRTGHLGVQVETASDPAFNELIQHGQRARLAFSAEPGAVEIFAHQIVDVVRGEREAATLLGECGAT